MKHTLIDKWEVIPQQVLMNEDLLFDGLYLPKGCYLNVEDSGLCTFGFRGSENPRILLRNKKWRLYNLEFIPAYYEHTVPELFLSSAKLQFVDYNERHYSRKNLEGITTGRLIEEVMISHFEVYYLQESGTGKYRDYDYDDLDDERAYISCSYEIDLDCAILTKFTNGQCILFHYLDGYKVYYGTEEQIKAKLYAQTHWFQYPDDLKSLKQWKSRVMEKGDI